MESSRLDIKNSHEGIADKILLYISYWLVENQGKLKNKPGPSDNLAIDINLEVRFDSEFTSPIVEIDFSKLHTGPTTLVSPLGQYFNILKKLEFYNSKYKFTFLKLTQLGDDYDEDVLAKADFIGVQFDADSVRALLELDFSTSPNGQKMQIELLFKKDKVVVDIVNRQPDNTSKDKNEAEPPTVGQLEKYCLETVLEAEAIFSELTNVSEQILSRIKLIQTPTHYFNTLRLWNKNWFKLNINIIATNLFMEVFDLFKIDNTEISHPVFGTINLEKSLALPDDFTQTLIENYLYCIFEFAEFACKKLIKFRVVYQKLFKIITADTDLNNKYLAVIAGKAKLYSNYRHSLFELIKAIKILEQDTRPVQTYANLKYIRNPGMLAYYGEMKSAANDYNFWTEHSGENRKQLMLKVEANQELFITKPNTENFISLVVCRAALNKMDNLNAGPYRGVLDVSPSEDIKIGVKNLLPAVFLELLNGEVDSGILIDRFIAEALVIAEKHSIRENGWSENPSHLPQFTIQEIVAIINRELNSETFPEFRLTPNETYESGSWVHSSETFMSLDGYLLLLPYPPIKLGEFELKRSFLQTLVMTLHEHIHTLMKKYGLEGSRQKHLSEYFTMASQFIILRSLIREYRNKPDKFSKLVCLELEKRIESREIFQFFHTFGIIGMFEILVNKFLEKQECLNIGDGTNNKVLYETEILRIFNQTAGKFFKLIYGNNLPTTLDEAMLIIAEYKVYLAKHQFYILTYVGGSYAGQTKYTTHLKSIPLLVS